jgi:phosphoglycolate phosphatase
LTPFTHAHFNVNAIRWNQGFNGVCIKIQVSVIGVQRSHISSTLIHVQARLQHFHGRRAIGCGFCVGDGLSIMVKKAASYAGHTDVNENQLCLLMERFSHYYSTHVAHPSCIFDGAIPLLTTLKANGIIIGLCTNKNTRPTQRILNQLSLTAFFDLVICGDTLAQRKPHPLPLQHALASHSVDPQQAIMLGDSINDVLCGRGAGMKVIGADYGYTDNWPDHAKPDASIKNLFCFMDAVNHLGFIHPLAA